MFVKVLLRNFSEKLVTNFSGNFVITVLILKLMFLFTGIKSLSIFSY